MHPLVLYDIARLEHEHTVRNADVHGQLRAARGFDRTAAPPGCRCACSAGSGRHCPARRAPRSEGGRARGDCRCGLRPAARNAQSVPASRSEPLPRPSAVAPRSGSPCAAARRPPARSAPRAPSGAPWRARSPSGRRARRPATLPPRAARSARRDAPAPSGSPAAGRSRERASRGSRTPRPPPHARRAPVPRTRSPSRSGSDAPRGCAARRRSRRASASSRRAAPRSGSVERASATASSPSRASAQTSKPAFSSSARRSSRMMVSSSAIRIRMSASVSGGERHLGTQAVLVDES